MRADGIDGWSQKQAILAGLLTIFRKRLLLLLLQEKNRCGRFRMQKRKPHSQWTLSLSSKWLFKHKDAGKLDEGVAIQNKSASPLLECTVEKYFETSEAGGETCHLGLLSLSIKRARMPSKKSGISLHTVRWKLTKLKENKRVQLRCSYMNRRARE